MRFHLLFLISCCLHAADPTIGARVDESAFGPGGRGIVVYVAAGAAATGADGTKAKPFAAFAPALAMAKTVSGPVKINIGKGVYRGHVIIDGDATHPLVIEGEAPGTAIISGATAAGWELSTWIPVSGVPGLYRKPWSAQFGLLEPTGCDMTGTFPSLAAFRRESVIVNGQPLRFIELERITYDFKANPRYIPGGRTPANAESMPPGSFAINDQMQDGSPEAGTVFLRLPAGADPAKAVVEVANDALLHGQHRRLVELNRGNLVVRNLVFQHAATQYNDCMVRWNAAALNEQPVDTYMANLLIERCSFIGSRGWGLGGLGLRDSTLKDNIASDNACGGFNPWEIVRVHLVGNDTSRNCWAAYDSQDGWLAAGVKSRMQDCLVERHIANDNGYIGFWLDCGWRGWNTNNRFVGCTMSGNRWSKPGKAHGLIFEIATGPNLVEGCTFADNNGAGFESSYASRGVTLTGCTIRDNHVGVRNVGQPKAGGGGPDEKVPDGATLTMRSNTISGALLVETYDDWCRKGSQMQASGNRYFSTTPAAAFSPLWCDKSTDLAGWQRITDLDADAVWLKKTPAP